MTKSPKKNSQTRKNSKNSATSLRFSVSSTLFSANAVQNSPVWSAETRFLVQNSRMCMRKPKKGNFVTLFGYRFSWFSVPKLVNDAVETRV